MATKSTKENKKSAEKVAGGIKKKTTDNTQKTTPKITRKKKTVIETHDGYPLTANESKFIDEYIKTGNGMQSYLTAYPKSNPKCARQNANRLLSKDYMDSEIRFRMEQAKNECIASATEIMQYFTDVMKGNIKDAFGLEASLAERTKAAVELAKRQIDIPQKLAGAQEPPEIKITLDWARPNVDSEERPKTVRELLGETMTEEEIDKYNGTGEE